MCLSILATSLDLSSGLEQKNRAKSLKSQINGPKHAHGRPWQGVVGRGSLRHATSHVGRAIEDPACSCSFHVPLQMCQPLDSRKAAGNGHSGPIRTHFGALSGPLENGRPMSCAIGHRSSRFCRFRATHGVPNASWECYIDLVYHMSHQMTSG